MKAIRVHACGGPEAMVLVLIAAVAWTTATHVDRLAPALLRRFGFAPFHLHAGDFVRLLTSVFLTHGGPTFYASLAMTALCVGLAEKRDGTWRTVLSFWGVHLATLLIQTLLLAIPAMDISDLPILRAFLLRVAVASVF